MVTIRKLASHSRNPYQQILILCPLILRASSTIFFFTRDDRIGTISDSHIRSQALTDKQMATSAFKYETKMKLVPRLGVFSVRHTDVQKQRWDMWCALLYAYQQTQKHMAAISVSPFEIVIIILFMRSPLHCNHYGRRGRKYSVQYVEWMIYFLSLLISREVTAVFSLLPMFVCLADERADRKTFFIKRKKRKKKKELRTVIRWSRCKRYEAHRTEAIQWRKSIVHLFTPVLNHKKIKVYIKFICVRVAADVAQLLIH